MALKLLVDTSGWLDLAKDYRQQPVIAALEDLVAAGEIELIVPQVLLDEFAPNKERVAIDATRSLQSHFNLVRHNQNAVGREPVGPARFLQPPIKSRARACRRRQSGGRWNPRPSRRSWTGRAR